MGISENSSNPDAELVSGVLGTDRARPSVTTTIIMVVKKPGLLFLESL